MPQEREKFTERVFSLLNRALTIFEEEMSSEDPKQRMSAARNVVGLSDNWTRGGKRQSQEAQFDEDLKRESLGGSIARLSEIAREGLPDSNESEP